LREAEKSKPNYKQIEILKENTVKSSTKEKAKGMFHQMKGKIKETAGNLTDNPKLETEGTVERIAGKAQEKLGQVKKVWGN
jgi:uncharacterized protein YjbJ (UPF0337 family)